MIPPCSHSDQDIRASGFTPQEGAWPSTIALNVLVMNLEKLLELLFVPFTALLRLLLINEGVRSIRSVPLKPQIAAA